MNRFGYRALVGATTALLAAVSASAASAQTTYYACRVPGVNIIYIRGTLVTDTCIDGAHVPFQWTDGGAPGANSVNSAAIIDGTIAAADHGAASVNSAAIVDGTIVAADLGAGAVTTAKIAAGAVPNWKAAVYNGSTITATAGSLTNIATLAYNAPTAGSVWVQSSGYCNVPSGASRQASLTWGLTALEGWSLGPSTFEGTSATGTYQVSYAVSRVQNVSAGVNTFYLNFENYGGGSYTCYGTNILAYTPAQLP